MALTNIKSLVFVATSSQHVSLGDVLGFERTSPRSISLWAKWNATGPSNYTMIGKMSDAPSYRGWAIRANAIGEVHIYLISNNAVTNQIAVQTTAAFNNGIWHHIVVTYSGSSTAAGVLVYVDGTLQTKTLINDALSATIVNTDELRFGARKTAGNETYFNGKIDEIAIYDKVLSAAEVGAISTGVYDLTIIGPIANLIGYWRMGDGDTYPTITDRSSGAHNGTMTNMSAGSIVTDAPYSTEELSLPATSMPVFPILGASWGMIDVSLPPVSMPSYAPYGHAAGVSTPIDDHSYLTIMNSTYGAHVRRALYKMRGKKADDSFETWTVVGEPNTLNPSGAPLTEIVVADKIILVSD